MVNWIQRIFLVPFKATLLVVVIGVTPWVSAEQEQSPSDIYEPKMKRQQVDESLIDDEDFEFGLYFGILNIEDFGQSTLQGIRFSYHLSESISFIGSLGFSEAGLNPAEELFPPLTILTAEQRKYEFYDVLVAWNILPGETFVTDGLAFNTSFYLVGGAGNTEFAGNTSFTYTFGAGYKILMNDWLAINMDMRDHMFNLSYTGKDKRTHNLEMSLGVSVFF